MWGRVAICVVGGASVITLWYLWFLRYNRRESKQITEWLQAALAGKGRALAIRWLGPSLFQVPLRLTTNVFQHPAVFVRLTPREMPFRWFLHWWRREPATITFEADMDIPPGFNLEVHQHRWSGRTTKKFSPDPEHWHFEQVTPIIMTSRRQWQREVAGMMNALLSCREREFVSIGFRRTSPHFSATVLLECISPAGRNGSNVFDMIRELAAGASASRM